jgi:uncharacterized protein YfaS (alpha-2-macroglobulin family)
VQILCRHPWPAAATAALVALLAAGPAISQPDPLRILNVTPTGEDVPPGRQIVLQFDRPMVPVGRMERNASELPIRIEPPLACEWRWLDTSALACQLGENQALKPATRYTLRLEPGLTGLDGAELPGAIEHHFLTQRPRVGRHWFTTWRAPGTPRIAIFLNQRVKRRALEKALRFELLDGSEVAVRAEFHDEKARDRERRWVVEPARELPHDALVSLRVRPGLESLEGPEPGAEDRGIVTFQTFSAPRFLGIRCTDVEGLRVRVEPDGDRQDKRCDPLEKVWLLFSSPVVKEVLRDHLGVTPDLAGGRSNYDPWEQVHSWSKLGRAHWRGDEYSIHLPGPLRAYHDYQLLASADAIRDEFNRPLERDIDLQFQTDDLRPLAVLTHPVSVLEHSLDTHVPVVVTNLQSLEADFQTLTADGVQKAARSISVERARNVAYRFPLRVREWLGGRSGALVGRLAQEPRRGGKPGAFFAQVTPFAVHAKVGHRNSHVWVTDLATGAPVEGAKVRVYVARADDFLALPKPLDESTTDAAGVAVLAGSEKLDPELVWLNRWWGIVYEYRHPRERLFLRVDKDGELALLPLSGDFTVYARGANKTWVPTQSRERHGHIRTWGTTAQGIYRVGDTLQYKIYVRDEGNERLAPAPRGAYTLEIVDPTDKVIHEHANLELNEFGALHGEFAIPENGAVGWYVFRLKGDFAEGLSWSPLRVLVADFTPAPFRVTTDVNGELWRPGDEVEIATQAALHAGGPYVDAQTRLTVTLSPTGIQTEDPLAQGYSFQTGGRNAETLHQSHGVVDQKGALLATVELPDSEIIHGRLLFESAVRDDRGKYVSGRSTARYVARDRFVGIAQPDWLLEGGKPAEARAVVVDAQGRVTAGVEVSLRIEYRETTASRVKGAGNAYLTKYVHEWVPFAECRERSRKGPAVCGFTPERGGLYRMTAEIEDGLGRPHASTLTRWATGQGHVLFEMPPGHDLAVLPEKTEYRLGETARFLIQNPFPGARALLSVERVGVLHSWTQTFASGTQVVEFEITEDHLPGFYFSAVVTSPRVEKPPGGDQVDLGKPAFRMGYARVAVRDPVKEIAVEVRPDRPVYEPRETVEVELEARTRRGETPPMEFAVAVLDESVFDLIQGGRSAFDPYEGFYQLGPLDLQNFNLLTRLIGIQKFAKKGANPGGGGGADTDLRSIFEFVSYWNPSLRTDSEGKARFAFQVPDNLTGWRVLAMAVTPGDRMGLGEGTFAVNRPTEIRPALPNQVIEGDRFQARFSVMNRTDHVRTLRVDARVAGPAEATGLAGMHIEAEPYRRYALDFPVRALRDGTIALEIRAGDAEDADALRLPLTVRRRQALEVAATYGTTADSEVREPITFPDDIRTDVGRVSFVAAASVIGGIEGAFRYMRDYPYACWEQRLSSGVMASHYTHLRAYLPEDLPDDLIWEGAAELPNQMLADSADFQAPNGGMVYWIPQDSYVSPYLSAYTALAFGWLRERGHEIPTAVEKKLHDYLRTLLRRDVFPSFFDQGMAASVRAVALAALAQADSLERAELERYAPHVARMDLFGKAHYLLATLELHDTGALRALARNDILAHADRSGGKFHFTEAVDTGFERILHTPLRSNCAILSTLVREEGQAPGGTGIGDIPFKLVRGISQARKRRDHWENTQENVFCMNALVDYSRIYESQPPRFSLEATLDGAALGSARFESLRAPQVEMSRPLLAEDPGGRAELRLSKSGPGRLYYALRLFFSPLQLRREPVNAGIEVRREYRVERDGEWQLLESPYRIRTGDLVRVDLYLSIPAARNFVVLDDPIPGGLEPVNRELATASTIDADKADFERAESCVWCTGDDWIPYRASRWSFYHRELRHHAARFFSDYLPAGNYHLSYVAQAIAAGEFQILPVRAEEMYDPDVFGQGVPTRLEVEPAQ